MGGYDTVFVELGWNHSTPKQIAFGRGAANMQGKDWGAIVTWTYNEPPYMENGTEVYHDMLSAYTAGAKYVLVFDDPRYPEFPNGTLTDDHFDAISNFNDYVKTHPRSHNGQTKGTVALVLPANYGWGARWHDEGLWGLWLADEKTPLVWENMNKLIDKYGLQLDIVFDDARFNPAGKYPTVYFWNATIT